VAAQALPALIAMMEIEGPFRAETSSVLLGGPTDADKPRARRAWPRHRL